MQEAPHFRDGWRLLAQRRLPMLCLLLMGGMAVPGSAQGTSGMAPADIEAAYLYNFGKFVRFPAAPATGPSTFAICILGDDEFGGALDTLVANESIQGRRIVTRRLASPAAANNCQIVFISSSEDARLQKDIAALEKRPVLTVSSLPQFLAQGGMVQFLLQNKRVRFAVNLTAASQTGLELSSELLKVAVRVDAKPAPEAK
jgi:hypothetical protein